MRYRTVFRPKHIEPAVTFWLMEVEGQDAKQALKPQLERIVTAAQTACLSYFGSNPFSRKELLAQISAITDSGAWVNVAEAVKTDPLTS